MALAKKCDRCGAYYETYHKKHDNTKTSGFQFLNLDENRKYFTGGAIDLCPACNDKLHEWLEHPERGGEIHNDRRTGSQEEVAQSGV